MKTTTEFRSHWTDDQGRCYSQIRPFTLDRLTPVINADEVRGWLRANAYCQGAGSGEAFHMEMYLANNGQVGDRAQRLICQELTDTVPYYEPRIREVFLAVREQWPLPPEGDREIVNLTPHPITVGEVVIPPSGTIARAIEATTSLPAIRMADGRDVPTVSVAYSGTEDLPQPQIGRYLVVSLVTGLAARAFGRWPCDLLIPGEQVRDATGRIVGCRSLIRLDDIHA